MRPQYSHSSRENADSKSAIKITEKASAGLEPTQVTQADCLCHVRVSKHEKI